MGSDVPGIQGRPINTSRHASRGLQLITSATRAPGCAHNTTVRPGAAQGSARGGGTGRFVTSRFGFLFFFPVEGKGSPHSGIVGTTGRESSSARAS